jgi:hypothetical protein
MSLRQALVGAHVIETATNYARADDPLTSPIEDSAALAGAAHTQDFALVDDEAFWNMVLRQPEMALTRTFKFQAVAVSEWVARVPGLGWNPDAIRLRNNVEHVEKMVGGFAYEPPVKSLHVMGGVGTLRLPPSDSGARLVSLSAYGDAAYGAPALMSADVWDKVQAKGVVEGRAITGKARWTPMTKEWADYFPPTRGVTRGYLLLNKPDEIQVEPKQRPTQIYPFTIMEYASGGSELFDYVYVGAKTDDKEHRGAIEGFFDKYKKEIGTYTRYLLAGDMITPLWDSDFDSPADLRRTDVTARSELSLLEARVREHQLGKNVIEQVLQVLTERLQDHDQVKVLAGEAGIPGATWYVGGTLAEVCSQLVDAANQANRLEALIQRLAIRYPGVF